MRSAVLVIASLLFTSCMPALVPAMSVHTSALTVPIINDTTPGDPTICDLQSPCTSGSGKYDGIVTAAVMATLVGVIGYALIRKVATSEPEEKVVTKAAVPSARPLATRSVTPTSDIPPPRAR